MTTRVLYVRGQKPAMGKEVNRLLKAFDLGVEGTFVPFCDKLTLTLKAGVTQEQLDKQIKAIRIIYEKDGCVDVEVYEGKKNDSSN